MTSSGKDTTLVGSQLQGQSVTVKTGGNLHIESVQDSETYRGNHSSTGISLEAKSKNASYSRGKTTSDYASVTEQAGIREKKIHVEGNQLDERAGITV